MQATPLKKIHLVFKTHLDIGFTDYASRVESFYLNILIPRAMDTARYFRETEGRQKFIWTTGSWLIHTYFEKADRKKRNLLELAIERGDIVWHGLPFSSHSELFPPSLFRFGLTLSQDLDKRFGRRTIAAKMTDVPGHTRSIVPLLHEAGIRFLHIGVNDASTPPAVPPIFRWRGQNNSEVTVMYKKGGYGGIVRVPGMSSALYVCHETESIFGDDNSGPPSIAYIQGLYQDLYRRYPGVVIEASTLENFARDLEEQSPKIPIITKEIGDTWIHGVGSDPTKVRHYRELGRLRDQWLQDGTARRYPDRFHAFSKNLLMVGEHTWGLAASKHFKKYQKYYKKTAFQKIRKHSLFQEMERSWREQRRYLVKAVLALGTTSLAREARKHLRDTDPSPLPKKGFRKILRRDLCIETPYLSVAFDDKTGSIISLYDKRAGRQWAGKNNPLGLYTYEVFGDADYHRFLHQYSYHRKRGMQAPEWFSVDFGKPGLAAEKIRHTRVKPKVKNVFMQEDADVLRVLFTLTTPNATQKRFGNPQKLFLEYSFSKKEPVLDCILQWHHKSASRIPEAMWFSFVPKIQDNHGWQLEKMGEFISPLEVIRDGNRKLHAIGESIRYTDKKGGLIIQSLDAPLVAPGEPSLLNFNNRQPNVRRGMHFNLFNNVWGTNFPQWFEDDARFRFVLRMKA